MLLSMIVALLLARKFRGKIYVLLIIISSALLSFLSVGVPSYHSIPKDTNIVAQSGILFDDPLPLSFPIYASLNLEFRGMSAGTQYYQLYFLMFAFDKNAIQSRSLTDTWLFMSWGDYILYYSFFVLVNIVGVAIGYWLSRIAFVEKLLKKGPLDP